MVKIPHVQAMWAFTLVVSKLGLEGTIFNSSINKKVAVLIVDSLLTAFYYSRSELAIGIEHNTQNNYGLIETRYFVKVSAILGLS